MAKKQHPKFGDIYTRSILLYLVFFTFTGCSTAILNEGATRARHASVELEEKKPSNQSDGAGELEPPNSKKTTQVKANQIKPFEAVFFRPKSAETQLIKTGDHFSLSLLSAHICGFSEKRGFKDILRKDRSNPPSAPNQFGCDNGSTEHSPKRKDRITKGEIAIVVNAGELSESKGLTVDPTKTGTQGRVIYYSEDIRESGQLINALNIPIYGPKQYTGKNFIFELSMIELDNQENAQMRSLLASLSEIGGKAYPPSAPILQVLNSLGGSLLTGNADDIEASFQMQFDVPAPPDSAIHRLPLAEGYYAFVREENRDLTPDWPAFTINRGLGELCEAKSRSSGNCKDDPQNTYRERTWFLIRIAKESRESALDLELGEELSEFLDNLDSFKAQDTGKISAALELLKTDVESLICAKDTVQQKSKMECSKSEAKNGEPKSLENPEKT